ncbi:VTC domain-containing protein [Methanosarcina sp. Mfa9]|uniref:VTC domain-containing protein n=1 Tax=Methanosarcina sp. Mfa9 TaxID=3439063 RepID=UPI003F82D777
MGLNMIHEMLKPASYRYERKSIISELSLHEVESIVRTHPAMFIECYPPRYINNIYLDTYSMSHYFDNIDGCNERLKARIRWYGEIFGFIENPVLEFKVKKGLLGGKVSFPLNSFCLDYNYSFSLQKEIFAMSEIPDLIVEYLKSLKFAILNRYCRKYFESPDHKFRITIDSDLEFYRLDPSNNSFNEKMLDYRNCVLEFKYLDTDDDFAESIFNNFPFRLTKSSKYAEGVGRVLQY